MLSDFEKWPACFWGSLSDSSVFFSVWIETLTEKVDDFN